MLQICSSEKSIHTTTIKLALQWDVRDSDSGTSYNSNPEYSQLVQTSRELYNELELLHTSGTCSLHVCCSSAASPDYYGESIGYKSSNTAKSITLASWISSVLVVNNLLHDKPSSWQQEVSWCNVPWLQESLWFSTAWTTVSYSNYGRWVLLGHYGIGLDVI